MIPGPSQVPLQHGQFTHQHLVPAGLLNDHNACSIISVFLTLHRLHLAPHFLEPDNMNRLGKSMNST